MVEVILCQEWNKCRLVKVCYSVTRDFEMTDSSAWVVPTVLILLWPYESVGLVYPLVDGRGFIIKQLPAMRLLQWLMFLPCRWIREMRTVVVQELKCSTFVVYLIFMMNRLQMNGASIFFLWTLVVYLRDSDVGAIIFFWIFLDLLKLCNFAMHELV